jgi:predicted HD superfamily hydrolase involved in NAD metabolism
MASFDNVKSRLEEHLSPKRFIHSLNVMDTAAKLGSKYGADEEKCMLAGLLHDCARDIKGEQVFLLCDRFDIYVDAVSKMQPELLHGPLGAKLAKQDYGVNDEQVLNAINYHTTGREGMSLLEKIVFIADYIEPGRKQPGVDEVRKIAFNDLDKAMAISLDDTLKYVLSKGALIHTLTVSARNYLILKHISG